MKTYAVIAVLLLLLPRCSESENSIVGLRFEHDIPNCSNGGNFEINCTEFMEFIDSSRLEGLFGGGDIVLQFNYRRYGNSIKLDGSGIKMSFIIQNEKTLLRTDDNSVWKSN